MMTNQKSEYTWKQKQNFIIQELIKDGKLELVTSFGLFYENDKNRVMHKKQAILEFMKTNGAYYVSGSREEAEVVIVTPGEFIRRLEDTAWQREYFDKMKPGQILEEAVKYEKEHPYKGGAVVI